MAIGTVKEKKDPKNRARAAIASKAVKLRTDSIRAFFQPIEHLQTGEVVGFEALARLSDNHSLISPDAFLPGLSKSDLVRLFLEMVHQALNLLETLAASHPHAYVSINVETHVLTRVGLCETLRGLLARHDYAGSNIVFELLEGSAITNIERMRDRVMELHAMGIEVALDDIGSAYGSLINLRNLPIDIIKLDQSFARGVDERPNDLHFILSVLSLTRGLNKKLIVEGIETNEILDAVRILGVDYGQGYAIARPMPPEAVAEWLKVRKARVPDKTPRSLLGAYAGHLTVVETCRVLMNQPLHIEWTEESKNPHSCAIGRYFDRHGLHETEFGLAHKRFHQVMALFSSDFELWRSGADEFRKALERSMATSRGARFICEPAMARA